MTDPNLKHNEKIARENAARNTLKPVPDVPAELDIQAVIDRINQNADEIEADLSALFVDCVRNKRRAVNFKGGGRWTNFPPAEGARLDIGLDRFVMPLITRVESVE